MTFMRTCDIYDISDFQVNSGLATLQKDVVHSVFIETTYTGPLCQQHYTKPQSTNRFDVEIPLKVSKGVCLCELLLHQLQSFHTFPWKDVRFGCEIFVCESLGKLRNSKHVPHFQLKHSEKVSEDRPHTWDVVVKTPARAGRHLSLHVALRFCENISMVQELEERLHRWRRKFKQLAKVLGQKIYTGIFVESVVIPGTP